MRFLRIGQALASESRDAPPTKEAGIVGVWEVAEEGMRIEVTLEADGNFTNKVTAEGETETIRGTYEFKDGMLIARPQNDDPLRFRAKLLDANRLRIQEETGEVTVLTRKKKARRGFFGTRVKEPKPKPDGRMVGDWLMRSAELQLRIVLRADGTYEETVRTKEGTETTKGRYEVSGGMLVARPESGAEPVRLKARLVDDDTLELLDADGNGVQLKRQG